MIDFLRAWVSDIVVVVILISFLEIILPKGNMKRYINMVIGLLIIIVLINPFINLLSKDIDIEGEVFKNIVDGQNIEYSNDEELKEIRQKQVIDIYKLSLKKEILSLIKSKTEHSVKAISVKINEDQGSEEFGNLQGVELLIDKGDKKEKGKEKGVNIKEIKRVSVTLDTNVKENKETNLKQYDNVRKILSEAYRIPKENINVSINKEG
ncbi:stage III sporulation protein AF [Dethiothermospora halolimnae]|uniref:stage III sporulation protein AF n=1 Tax=Dethiothermospora halolimnae TaxID=3114390 RepID=UPI003CCBF2E5